MSATTDLGSRLQSIEPAFHPRLAADALQSKYRAPSLGRDFVERTELLKRLDDARTHPLVLVVAPAGYGKTTLLAQWAELDQRPVGWVTLDEADNDPESLADAIATATARIWHCSRFLLVLDGAEVIGPELLAEVILDVLAGLPEGSQVAAASRCGPALPLGSMRGRRLLIELGARDLAMSTVEAASLLRGAGLDLDFASIQAIVRRTEGWPVALELAALSLATLPDQGPDVAQFAGEDYLLSEYFLVELLSELSPATIRFLTRSSVLDRLSGQLCDTVLERKQSAGLLARLARANVPLQAVDASHEWYRLHGLFREMLQAELRRADPGLELALHRRAEYWHSREGDIHRAIEHAVAAGDLDRTGELLWANIVRYLGEGRNDAVQRWLSGITAGHATGHARLALAAAHSHVAHGSIAVAEQWAQSAAAALSAEPAESASAERAVAAIVEAWAARQGPRRMGEDATRAYELLPDDSAWRAICCFLRGTAALLVGDFIEAQRHLDAGAARGASVAPHAAALCLAQSVVVAFEQDDPEIAGDLARRSQLMIEEHNLSRYPSSALVLAAAAAAGVRQGRVDEAKAAGSECGSLLAMLDEFVPWYGAETRILLARGLLALGDVTGARERLAEASRLARRTAGVTVFQGWFDAAWDQFDKRAESALIGVGSLTTAELRVLRFLPTHYSFHEIAERLQVSSNTVKTHVHAVYRKLDACSRSEAVANATGAGLLG